jgi:hypothetical protein
MFCAILLHDSGANVQAILERGNKNEAAELLEAAFVLPPIVTPFTSIFWLGTLLQSLRGHYLCGARGRKGPGAEQWPHARGHYQSAHLPLNANEKSA